MPPPWTVEEKPDASAILPWKIDSLIVALAWKKNLPPSVGPRCP